MGSELKSDLQEAINWCRKRFIDFNAGKTELFWFDCSNNSTAIVVKMDGCVHEKKSSFKMLEPFFSCKLEWDSYVVSSVKTVSKKFGTLIHSMKFLSPKVALYLPYSLACSHVKHLVVIWIFF